MPPARRRVVHRWVFSADVALASRKSARLSGPRVRRAHHRTPRRAGAMTGRLATPTLVGRADEVAALVDAYSRAVDGQPAVVLIGGEAGVGKSRLVAEATARMAD